MSRRRGRPETPRIKQIKQQIYDGLFRDHPQSVRHIFYLQTNPGLLEPVDKSQAGYDCVQRCCLELRRCGAIPYAWIVDSSRRGYHVLPFSNGGDLIWHYAALYRRDLWFATDVYVEVWCESESIGAVIQSECDRLGVSLYPTRGFSSVTLTSQAAEGIRAWSRERPVKIVYVGDYDPAGVLIDDKVMAELRQHLPNHDLEKIRVAITAEQAVKLPSKPRRKGEKRRRDILRTVEAEAMPAGELRALLGASVEAFLPPGALHAAQVAERAERDGLQRLAELTSELGVQAVNSIIENAPPRRSRDDV